MPLHSSRRSSTEDDSKKSPPPYKRLQAALPWLGGGALAAAGASEFVRRGVITPELQNDMSDFSRKLDSDKLFGPYAHLPEDEQAIQAVADYAIQGNKLLKNRFFGGVASPTGLLKLVRSIPYLNDENSRWTPNSQAHYDTFERAPVAGMTRVLGEMALGGWERTDKTKTPRLPDATRDSIRAAVNNLAGFNYADTQSGDAYPRGSTTTGPKWQFPAIGMPESLDATDQLKLMRNLGPELKQQMLKQPDGANLWAGFVNNVRDSRNTVYNAYGKLTDGLQAVNRHWGGGNLALAGGGAAALGGYGIWKLLDYQRKKKQEEARRNNAKSAAVHFTEEKLPMLSHIFLSGWILKQSSTKSAGNVSALLKLLTGSAAAGGAVVGGRHAYQGFTGTKDKLDNLLVQAGDAAGGVSKTVGQAQPVIQEALEGVNKTQHMLDTRTKNLQPLIGGAVGASAGHLIGALLENSDERNFHTRARQRRNRLLLTLLGGVGGAGLGAMDVPTTIAKAKDWAAGLGKTTN